MTVRDKYGKTPSKFSKAAFGGGEKGEFAAWKALQKHEAALTDGTRVRVYRGPGEGQTGVLSRLRLRPLET